MKNKYPIEKAIKDYSAELEYVEKRIKVEGETSSLITKRNYWAKRLQELKNGKTQNGIIITQEILDDIYNY